MSGSVDPEVLAGLEVHLLPEQVERDEERLLRDFLLLLDLRAHRLDADRGQEDEHDGRHGSRSRAGSRSPTGKLCSAGTPGLGEASATTA